MRELHWPAKTEQKLALGGWHSANALALLFVTNLSVMTTVPLGTFIVLYGFHKNYVLKNKFSFFHIIIDWKTIFVV